jgi:hypothetical protein
MNICRCLLERFETNYTKRSYGKKVDHYALEGP